MSDDERIFTIRQIKAPAAKIFDLVRRPEGHVRIDGSGMLLAAPDATPVEGVGDTFGMHMDRRPLGDIPEMAEYDVTVVITAYEQDALLEWSVLTAEGVPYGHVYGYQLEAIDDTQTSVTSYYDWSGLPEHRKGPRWPIVPLRMLDASMDNLERIVTE